MQSDNQLYVDNDDLLRALLASHAMGQLTYECLDLFEKIVKQRIYKYLVYNRDVHFEPMLDFCMNKLYRVWHAFRFENNNAFAYFVSIIDNSIRLYFADNQIQYVSIDEQNERFNEKA